MSSSFPLPWERVRWRSRRLAVSDFRVVQLRRGAPVAEVAIHDISSIHVIPSLIERTTGVGTVVITSARDGDRSIRVRVAGARGTALRLNLLVTDLQGVPPADEVMDLSAFGTWRLPPTVRLQATLIAPAVVLLTLVFIVIGLSGHEVRVAYGADDPIRPNGIRRSREDIVAFMEGEVMPWARTALQPVVGSGRVTCETCHGADAEEKGWRMPAVRALPEPAVRDVASGAGSDSQMRNALHGYVAQERNLAIAAHMRGVVVPGMAALLRRPAYVFAQTYEYNRARDAFGCYHCHVVGSP
jgi:hypothetical protein